MIAAAQPRIHNAITYRGVVIQSPSALQEQIVVYKTAAFDLAYQWTGYLPETRKASGYSSAEQIIVAYADRIQKLLEAWERANP